jgi:hypothetical protein
MAFGSEIDTASHKGAYSTTLLAIERGVEKDLGTGGHLESNGYGVSQ